MLNLKLQYFGHLMLEVEGVTEDETVGCHHELNGHEFEQILGDSEGQRSLGCCRPLCCRVGSE